MHNCTRAWPVVTDLVAFLNEHYIASMPAANISRKQSVSERAKQYS